MSKNIKERRKESANVPEQNRASLVENNGKRTSSVGRIILLVVVIAVLLTSAILVAANFLVDKFTGSIANEGNYKENELNKDSINVNYEKDAPVFSEAVQGNDTFRDYALLASQNHSTVVNNIMDTEDVFNYGIYGLDSSTNDVDIIIIASINKKTNVLKYVLLDDKMLVSIPYTEKVGCLEDAYGFGGANLLSRTIAQNFGIDIDGYMVLDMEGVANLANDQETKLEIAMTVAEIEELNDSIKSYNERFNGVEGFEKLATLDASKDRTVTLEGYYVVAYARGTKGLDDAAIFKLLAGSTKKALSKGVEGVESFTKLLTDNAKISATSEDFSSLLQLVAVASKDLEGSISAEDFAEILAKDKLITKTVYVKGDDGKSNPVPYVVVDDYSAMVTELQNKLYK